MSGYPFPYRVYQSTNKAKSTVREVPWSRYRARSNQGDEWALLCRGSGRLPAINSHTVNVRLVEMKIEVARSTHILFYDEQPGNVFGQFETQNIFSKRNKCCLHKIEHTLCCMSEYVHTSVSFPRVLSPCWRRIVKPEPQNKPFAEALSIVLSVAITSTYH